MLRPDLPEGFDWDEGNAFKSRRKHGVTPAEAEQVFFNDPLLIVEDVKHSGAERRWQALGKTNADRSLHVTFTLRGGETKLRVISARDMSRRERAIYAEEA